MNKLPLILSVGVLLALGLSGIGFQYFAVSAFEVGTDREYIPRLESSPARAKCVKPR